MKLDIRIKLPQLWGDDEFLKTDWGTINYLVGPNGTGKTLFAEVLERQCRQQELRVRYLSAERLVGLERKHYGIFAASRLDQGFNIGQFSDYVSQGGDYGLAAYAWVILRQKLDVKIRVEATLSALFGRRLRLAEEGGFLKPKVEKTIGGGEYDLKESECHGLKEIMALLAFLYDDEFNCLIVDEPELHLHPQYQAFFMEEVRRLAGDPREDPGAKCFFLISHSPYLLDFRSLADLEHCIVFQPNAIPTFIDLATFDGDDHRRLQRLLPRLNTHHKQFFFATQPLFVEGYTDQQIIALIQEVRQVSLGAHGVSVIDVQGKDELDLFFRLARHLQIDARIIADLDVLIDGQLRQSVANDPRVAAYFHKEGLGTNGMTVIGQLLQELSRLLEAVENLQPGRISETPVLEELNKVILNAGDDLNRKRYVLLLAVRLKGPELTEALPSEAAGQAETVRGRSDKILSAFTKAGVFILPNGAIENYMPSYDGIPYLISDDAKGRIFEAERAAIEAADKGSVEARYPDLCNFLDGVSTWTGLDMDMYLSIALGDWVHVVQSAHLRGEVRDIPSLQDHPTVNWHTYSRVLDILVFEQAPDGFRCRIQLKPIVDPEERKLGFDHTTVAASFRIDAAI